MQIQVNGKQIDVGDALRSHVTERLTGAVTKYYDRAVDAQVTFSKEGHEFRTDCTLHLSTGMRLHAHSSSSDIYAAFEGAVERLEKRLRRYKRRLKDHHAQAAREALPMQEAPSYVIAADEEEEVAEDLQPVIIAETRTPVRTLTVGEAVMVMDFEELPALVFRNRAHGGINVVYRRADGNIGWIDPAVTGGA
jgi:ribosomal subunit interface protein